MTDVSERPVLCVVSRVTEFVTHDGVDRPREGCSFETRSEIHK